MTAIAKYRKDENFAEWAVSNYTMEQVEGLITSQEAKLTTLRSELVRLTEKYSHPCPNPMCVGGDNGTPEKCSKCHGAGRIWMLGCESAEVKRLAKELETVGIKYTAMAMHSNPTLRDREIITNLRDDVKRLTKELENNIDIDYEHAAVAWNAERDAERKAIRELLIEEGILRGHEPIATQNPTHGSCCTCQKCGSPHDECVCTHNEVLEKLARIERGDFSTKGDKK